MVMHVVGFHWFDLITLCMPVVIILIPLVIGFVRIRPDADMRGQPGWLWAVLTLPLSWVAILAYLVVRAAVPPTTPR
jgi:hypothetical protein